ncbi:unnamed protein product [Schistosoma turkestanicum]|nr:unnamed protein product [Schistosoma turkestanicum]
MMRRKCLMVTASLQCRVMTMLLMSIYLVSLKQNMKNNNDMSYTAMEEFHSTDANADRIDATCLAERNHDDVDNNLDVTDVTNELPTMTNADQTSSVSGDGEINIDPTSCYLKSSGDDEMSKLEIPPLHIIYESRIPVDKLASRTSLYLLIGASGGGLATRPHDRECSSRIGYDQFYDVLYMFVWVNWVRFILPLGDATIDRGIKGLMGKYRYLVSTIGHIHVGWRVGVLL